MSQNIFFLHISSNDGPRMVCGICAKTCSRWILQRLNRYCIIQFTCGMCAQKTHSISCLELVERVSSQIDVEHGVSISFFLCKIGWNLEWFVIDLIYDFVFEFQNIVENSRSKYVIYMNSISIIFLQDVSGAYL